MLEFTGGIGTVLNDEDLGKKFLAPRESRVLTKEVYIRYMTYIRNEEGRISILLVSRLAIALGREINEGGTLNFIVHRTRLVAAGVLR